MDLDLLQDAWSGGCGQDPLENQFSELQKSKIQIWLRFAQDLRMMFLDTPLVRKRCTVMLFATIARVPMSAVLLG